VSPSQSDASRVVAALIQADDNQAKIEMFFVLLFFTHSQSPSDMAAEEDEDAAWDLKMLVCWLNTQVNRHNRIHHMI